MSESNPLRFRTVRVEHIYYKDKLCDEFKNSRFPMPENIRKGRNTAIVLGFIEFVCCLASFAFYARRRSRVILALIVFSWISTIGGFYSKLKLSYCGLLTHACFSISFIGGFYIYIMIDYIVIGEEVKTMDPDAEYKPMGSVVAMIFTSLPLFSLFIMGIYSCVLAIMVDDELEARKKVM